MVLVCFIRKPMNGRKYWVWGNDVHDASRMNFLSSPGSGHYIEMQAGVAPTQSQTFTLGGNDNLGGQRQYQRFRWMQRKFQVNTQMLLKP